MHSRRMAFSYEKAKRVADFYLLGQARKTGAYVIIAWCVEPIQEWRLLRFALIKDLEQIGHIDVLRRDFNPYNPKILFIDTQAFPVRRPHH
jgi:hypothetical protein